MDVQIKLSQGLALSPRMLLSAKILQMGAQELSEYLRKLGEENPAVELEPGRMPQGFRLYRERRVGDLELLENQAAKETGDLRESLLSQLHSTPLSPTINAAAEFIINSLNPDGMLDQSAEDLQELSGFDKNTFAAALATVRYMEPAGVAAENLSQCLLLQLERFERREPLAEIIVRDHLRLLAKGRLDTISRNLGISMEDTRRAVKIIRSLSPRPAASEAVPQTRELVIPDCVVTRSDDGELTLDFAEGYLPELTVSPYYLQMLRESDDPEVREYLQKKIDQAKWTIYSIQQRKNTVLRCVSCIISHQKDFFLKGEGNLTPLTMADVAQELDMSVSTVSRAIKDKYVQWNKGVLPLKRLLSRKLGAGSAADARLTILQLIKDEDSAKPLSDERIAKELCSRGFEISRRTVAKYRMELNVPDAYSRRRR
ncbi:MAG: RNA polymerase factor sigma-54 [Oscillospiraceae bacterium]|nr:RNA polymerase factor sigma-54 [Oscillospiraceae bacterium]